MITAKIRVQLLVFLVVTLLGVTYVGARYAQLDRYVVDRSYLVVVHAAESGGIFVGSDVTYRGVGIGRVTDLELTREGVDVHLRIEREWDDIPADVSAVISNRSPLGEQYVELQPHTDGAPYLEDGSVITEVTVPIRTEKLLGDLADTVASVDRKALRTTVEEWGAAFAGSGDDLQRIIDTGTSFITTADENFDLTTALIRDTNTVLQGQVSSRSSLRTFARELRTLTHAVAGADEDLRRVIDSGSYTADQLRTFLQQNEAQVTELIRDVVTTGRVVTANLPGIRQALIVYPVVLESGFTTTSLDPGSDHYSVHGGLSLAMTEPCVRGYEGTDRRAPQDLEPLEMNLRARCLEPPTQSNPRGYQNLPRVGLRLAPRRTLRPPLLGGDSWRWLYLQPLLG